MRKQVNYTAETSEILQGMSVLMSTVSHTVKINKLRNVIPYNLVDRKVCFEEESCLLLQWCLYKIKYRYNIGNATQYQSVRGKRYFSFSKFPDWLCGPPRLAFNGDRRSFLGVKCRG